MPTVRCQPPQMPVTRSPDLLRRAWLDAPETPFSRLGARTGGVWTSADAAAADVTPGLIRWLVGTGEWRSVHRWTFVRGGSVPDERQRAWAALLAVGAPQVLGGPLRAIGTGRTAARIWDLPLLACRDGDDVAVSAVRQVRTRPGIRVVQRSAPLSVTFSDALPLAAPALVALDLVPLLGDVALVCAIDALLHQERLRLTDLPQTGRNSARLRAAAAQADGRAESPLETLGRLAARELLPDVDPQLPVLGGARRLDLACRRLRLAIEGDGAGTHAGAVSLLADRRREEQVRGWRFFRYGWDEVWPSPRPMQRRLRALLADLS